MENRNEILNFVKKLNETYDDYTFDVTFGRKYARVITSPKLGAGKSAWGFVDTNGDIWKPAGWNSPTKNFSRGNIAEDFNIEKFRYGAN